jgi:hypothetical protein
MKTVSVADMAEHFSDYLEQSRTEGPIAITQDDEVLAVLFVPRDREDLERLALGHLPRFQALLDQSWQSIRAGKGLTADVFWEAVERRHRGNQPLSKV